jgi:hypothetical protein
VEEEEGRQTMITLLEGNDKHINLQIWIKRNKTLVREGQLAPQLHSPCPRKQAAVLLLAWNHLWRSPLAMNRHFHRESFGFQGHPVLLCHADMRVLHSIQRSFKKRKAEGNEKNKKKKKPLTTLKPQYSVIPVTVPTKIVVLSVSCLSTLQ